MKTILFLFIVLVLISSGCLQPMSPANKNTESSSTITLPPETPAEHFPEAPKPSPPQSTTNSTMSTTTSTIKPSTTTTTTTIPTIHDESENVEVQETINQKTIHDSAQQQTIENSSGTKYLAIIFVLFLIVIIRFILKK